MKLLAALLLTSLFHSSAWGFTLNSSTESDLKGWPGGKIEFMVNTANCPAGVDVAGTINAAAEVWNNAPTSRVKAKYGGTTTATTHSDPPVVYCEVNFNSITGADEDYVPGAGSIQTASGQISGGLLILNASSGQGNIGNFDQTALKVILAHEIGHVIGLGHSSDTAALMYYDASAKTHLMLSQDDVDGISYLYPRNEMSGDKPFACGQIKAQHPPSSITRLLLFLFPLFVIFKLRRRKLAALM